MKELATVTSDGLNLHKEPHKTAPLKDELTKNDTIMVDHYGKGNWLYGKVVGGKALGKSGWVDKRFVSIAPLVDIVPPPPPAPLPKPLPKPSYTLGAMVVGAVFAVIAALAWLFGR